MKCHYEVLNVPLTVSDDELKKAYRSLALKWHPDKNPDNIGFATNEFQIVQQAYSVLSDPHERAFYDKHREQILKGANSGYKDAALNVYAYYSNNCYSGFDDDKKGFYTVYREVFNKLIAEESEYYTDDFKPPEFGYSHSPYEVAQEFYSYWSYFCTKKSFTWEDLYDLREAGQRRVMRLMEQENKKVREKFRKERNEEVRALVSFVRKRDKRVLAHAEYLKEKAAENMKKAEESRRRMIEKHKEEVASYKHSAAFAWDVTELESDLKRIESDMLKSSDSHSLTSDDTVDELYCVACDKSFKTEMSFQNHERSKKHRDYVAFITKQMNLENKLIQNNASDECYVTNTSCDNVFSCTPCNKQFKSEKALFNHEQSAKHKNTVEAVSCVYSENTLLESDSCGRENLSNESNAEVELLVEETVENPSYKLSKNEKITESAEREQSVPKSKKKKERKNRKNFPNKKNSVCEKETEEFYEDYNNNNYSRINVSDAEGNEESVGTEESSDNSNFESNSSRKKKQKKKNKKNKEKKVGNNTDNTSYLDEICDIDTNHVCAMCKQTFTSKNKLFQHLKDSGHLVYLPSKPKTNQKSKKRCKNK